MGAIVHNTGTNYTQFYNVINYLAEIIGNHPSVASVGTDDIVDFDEREFPNYPVVNINILRTVFGTSTTDFDVQLMIADKYKNKNNESNPRTNEMTNAFFGMDDMVDVWDNTLAVMNDITAYLQRNITNFDINNDINCRQFHERFDSGLAGWVVTFTLTTHNDKNRCLFELYPN
jgi:hypothetical protein